MELNVEAWLAEKARDIEAELDRLLPPEDGPAARLAAAMRYAALGGGKRLRPALVLACCRAAGGDETSVLGPAAAVEMIHAYSLVHDDLPAMDDDDLRRGRPTTHRAFGEAIAILAGDALLTLGFEVLASRPVGDSGAARRAEAVRIAALAAGAAGMVGGQMADLEAERVDPISAPLAWIHEHKTGSLMAAAAEIGGIHGGASGAARVALSRFGRILGLAFQIADDILDLTSTREALGKTPGKDRAAGKATWPAVHGLERSRREAAELAEAAAAELAALPGPVAPLRALARFAASRAR